MALQTHAAQNSTEQSLVVCLNSSFHSATSLTPGASSSLSIRCPPSQKVSHPFSTSAVSPRLSLEFDSLFPNNTFISEEDVLDAFIHSDKLLPAGPANDNSIPLPMDLEGEDGQPDEEQKGEGDLGLGGQPDEDKTGEGDLGLGGQPDEDKTGEGDIELGGPSVGKVDGDESGDMMVDSGENMVERDTDVDIAEENSDVDMDEGDLVERQ